MSTFVNDLKKYEDFVSLPQGASNEEIERAESELNLKFSAEYRKYTAAVGSASADGHEFTGVVKPTRIDVVKATQAARKKNPNIPDTFYLVEDLNIDKILIWQDKTGNVYESSYKGEPKKIADSLLEYLKV